MSLSLPNLLYGDSITRSRRLVPPVGRGFGPISTQGIGAPGLLPGDCGVFEVLQAIATAVPVLGNLVILETTTDCLDHATFRGLAHVEADKVVAGRGSAVLRGRPVGEFLSLNQ